MTRIKICGVTDASHAIAAAQAGADFIGLNFVPGSPRRLTLDKAREIISTFHSETAAGARPKLVGVFADQPLAEVSAIAGECALDAVQLSGQESIDYCAHIELPLIKAVHVGTGLPKAQIMASLYGMIDAICDRGYMCLLDTNVPGLKGGSGRTFDWAIAEELAVWYPFLLAGGLTPENVAEAVSTVHPWGVDVASGVETAGKKDVDKIAGFIRRVRKANAESTNSAPAPSLEWPV